VRLPKLTKLELQIMETLWTRGAASVREIQEAFPERDRPAYTTVQTMVYRLEAKKAIRRVKKIGNAHIFDAVVSRSSAHRRVIDEFLSFFGGRSQPVVMHLIESGNLTLEDVKEAEELLTKLKSGRSGRSGKSESDGSKGSGKVGNE
jgi:BlaI family transcriptional regulator, penicillinase repressor